MIVMMYYENGNIYQYLDRSNGILSWSDIIDTLWGIAGGLERIHAEGKIQKSSRISARKTAILTARCAPAHPRRAPPSRYTEVRHARRQLAGRQRQTLADAARPAGQPVRAAIVCPKNGANECYDDSDLASGRRKHHE